MWVCVGGGGTNNDSIPTHHTTHGIASPEQKLQACLSIAFAHAAVAVVSTSSVAAVATVAAVAAV